MENSKISVKEDKNKDIYLFFREHLLCVWFSFQLLREILTVLTFLFLFQIYQ